MNSPELRNGLLKVYQCLALGLTEAEWRAIKGLRRQLECAADRQRSAFTPEEQAAEGKDARENSTAAEP